MIKITPQVAQAIVALQSNPDFQVFMLELSNRGEELVKQVFTKPDLNNPEFIRGLGSGITEVLELVHTAPTALEAFNKK